MNKPALIPVQQSVINSRPIQTVNARGLHKFLGVGKDFSNWIKDRIKSFDFVENQDFVKLANSGELSTTGQTSIDYHLTLDMAKELSMVERTEKGKQARLYFIEMERIAKLPPLFPDSPLKSIPQDRYCELLESENMMLRHKYEYSKNPAPMKVKADNILYTRFMELYGHRMNVASWMRLKGITLSEETVTKSIYRNVKLSPQNFAVLAHHLDFSRAEIIKMLSERTDAKSFLSVFELGGAK